MGEMIDAVAHQWKQPLTAISNQALNLKMRSELGEDLINEEYISNYYENLNRHIHHMTSTLNEFRSFFRPSKDQSDFNVKDMLKKVLVLVKDELLKYDIKVEIKGDDNFTLYGIENEFKHLVINIINNSKDAFVENSIKDKKILISLKSNEKYKYIELTDNAGGIPENIIGDIFKSNVTTKEEGKGTGIGLYMSSQIAQKHNGILGVKNVPGGAKFIFKCRR